MRSNGEGSGPVARPVFKTVMSVSTTGGGFDSLPSPPFFPGFDLFRWPAADDEHLTVTGGPRDRHPGRHRIETQLAEKFCSCQKRSIAAGKKLRNRRVGIVGSTHVPSRIEREGMRRHAIARNDAVRRNEVAHDA